MAHFSRIRLGSSRWLSPMSSPATFVAISSLPNRRFSVGDRSSCGLGLNLKSKLIQRVAQQVFEKHYALISNSTLFICVSGGIDSVATLRLMLQLKEVKTLAATEGLDKTSPYHKFVAMIPKFDIEVIHFNHNLRPESEVTLITPPPPSSSSSIHIYINLCIRFL
jgi:hypothetical protein